MDVRDFCLVASFKRCDHFLTTIFAACKSPRIRCFFSVILLAGFSNAALAGTLSLGHFDQGVFSGTEPFNVTGTCSDPGDDCGNNDHRIRTIDLIQYAWSITARDIANGEPEFQSVVLEQTLVPGVGADLEFERIPTICLAPPQGTGGENPLSSITENPDGSITLLCNIGSLGNGDQVSFSVPVRPRGTSVNGSTFTTQQKVYALDIDGNKIVQDVEFIDSTVYEISAAPAFDLMGNQRPIYRGYVANYDLGEGDGSEPGYVLYWTADIGVDPDRAGVGIESLSDSFTFNPGISFTKSDGVTPYEIPYKIIECTANTSGWGNSVFGKENTRADYGIETKVVDSGTCTRTGDYQSGYTFTVDGADTTGDRYPTERVNGSSLLAGPYFVSSYRLRIWIPFSAIDAEDGNPTNSNGAIRVTSCLSDFDPISSSGVSNYAGNQEPGFNGAAMPDGSKSNNCTGPYSVSITTTGYYNQRVVETATDSGSFSYGSLVSRYHDGTGVVEPGLSYGHMSYFVNTGSNTIDNFEMCIPFDNTQSRLTDSGNIGASPGRYAYIASLTNGGFDPTKWKIQYGSAPLTGDDPLDMDADGIRDFNPETGRFEGDWSAMKAMRCDNAAITWSEDADAAGLDNINIVRAIPVDPVSTGLGAAQQLRLFLPLEARNTFNGGPYDGEIIPVGTVAAAMGTFRSDNFYSNWRNIGYNPSPENTRSDGDRVTLSRVTVDVAKSTVSPAAPAGTPISTLAGNNVVWQLDPVVNSKLNTGSTAANMRLIDVLPDRLDYNDACTRKQSGGVTPTLIEFNKPELGQTTLTWTLGDVSSLDSIAPIVYCTTTDPLAPADTVVINTAYAAADNAIQSSVVEQRIALGQIGNIQAKVKVDVPLDDPDSQQSYTLSWFNFSASVRVEPPTLINVLPYLGDSGGLSARSPASNFSGTLQIDSEPVVTFSDGSLPGNAEAPIGILSYSSDEPATINHNPDDNTSNWCTFDGSDFLGSSCPATWSEVTAVKHVSNYIMETDGDPRQGLQMRYSLNANGNASGNRYTNVFGIDSLSLPAEQYIKAQRDSVQIASYSIGDFVFVDSNNNGSYQSAEDYPAPDGIPVELYSVPDNSLLSATTTQGGKFLFDRLGKGDYYLKIPANVFENGGLLQGWNVAVNGQPSNSDVNQDADHSGMVNGDAAIDGVYTDTISLSATEAESNLDAPSGNEPIGDNVLGVADPNTNDDFSNLTVDIGLISGDADNDGIPDVAEYGNGGPASPDDLDNDGIANYLDSDSDNDGLSDSLEAGSNPETPRDSDNDGTPDFLDRDSDQDSVPDSIEGATDTDNDGTANYLDLDSDNDGHSDSQETTGSGKDTDNDGIDDLYDVDETGGVDSNSDGVDDLAALLDTDGDGVSDYTDTDSDNDGIEDSVESVTVDSDGDGIFDYIDYDSDNDGIPDAIEGVTDTDSDLVPGYRDLDSDNDGIPDSREADTEGTDADADGIENRYDVDFTGGTDSNSDGIDDSVVLVGEIDSDADTIPDYRDLDSDNDGLTDTFEARGADIDGNGLIDNFADTNSDGIDDNTAVSPLSVPDTDADNKADFRDLDSDEDGITDIVEAGGQDTDHNGLVDDLADVNLDGLDDVLAVSPLSSPDTDSDLVANLYDTDSDNDSISDAIEGVEDRDEDGLANYVDTDSDSDGIADSVEGIIDTDIDSLPNYLDTDSDADGISDSVEGVVDTDSDSVPNYLDSDSDNDSISDSFEGVVDTDSDTTPDYIDTDSDNDGIDDVVEGIADTDSDTTPNFRDLDSDSDGINDAIEGLGDIDGDDAANYIDIDSDGDGIADSIESDIDSDSDGMPDYLDLDSDNDGRPDSEQGITDTDGDGEPDYLDDDTDGDGIDDLIEGHSDDDSDGVSNDLDLDSDNDGIPDAIETAIDTDNDGVEDYRDLDSDNDGVSDLAEIAVLPRVYGEGEQVVVTAAVDENTDQRVDGPYGENGLADALEIEPEFGVVDYNSDGLADEAPDTDADGIPDYLDSDSDNDSINDLVESGGTDTDLDGLVDTWIDTNSDGLDDGIAVIGLSSPDSDGDQTPDRLDLDSDGDNIEDSVEGLRDSDEDGVADYLDNDSDADGIPDRLETAIDSDADGFANYRDTDSDGDGIADSVETRVDTDADSLPDYLDTDSDGDGIPDSAEGNIDTDNDSIADFRDTDSDNDAIEDSVELQIDSDGDAIADYLDTDSDADGIEDIVEGLVDTDGDTVPDYLDLDSDADGIADSEETAVDTDADGVANFRDPDSDGDGHPDSEESEVDTDEDGIADYLDTDSDGDSIDDSLEGSVDSDGDNIPDYLDTDSDNDGINDDIEGGIDIDEDGIENFRDLDSDNDGLADSLEGAVDSDEDGQADFLDLDSDNDTIEDKIESSLDSDEDQVPDYLDQDSDNDGIRDKDEGLGDPDFDDTPNYRDLDSDNDGIPDQIEGLVDTDEDGTPNYLDNDSDGDAIEDSLESSVDTDSDGVPDYLDSDSDGDSITDSEEGTLDSDEDGVLDFRDNDSDGDGIEDAVEGTVDTDEDGLPDYRDLDSDNDSHADQFEGSDDSDGDGVADYRDLDSDNDGIADSSESSGDTDGDGVADYLDLDSDNDGVLDIEEGSVDSDEDGVADFRDLDSDGDSVYDVVEHSLDVPFDEDGNGRLDAPYDSRGVAETVRSDVEVSDVDTDGLPDRLDLDTDNDGISDIVEQALDTDLDGLSDFRDIDSDNDGISDSEEGNTDTDGDSIPDFRDSDSDNDGISDAVEGETDTDSDNVADFRDLDSDNDGINDVIEGSNDFDEDGVANYRDLDSDDDGIPDSRESVTDSDNDNLPDYLDRDSDNDGIADSQEAGSDPENPVDSDGDSIPDYLDTDSDNDGLSDSEEGVVDTDGNGVPDYLDTDSDGDGIPDSGENRIGDSDGDSVPDNRDVDADNDGIPDHVEGSDDSDSDGVANYLDLDSDNDGITDLIESRADLALSIRLDRDQDGVIDESHTVGSNGLANIVETTADSGEIFREPLDSDQDGLPDYIDLDSDNDGLTDLSEAGGVDDDSNGLVDGFGDTDSDGLDDAISALPLDVNDTDRDTVPDFRDIDSDNDGIPEMTETEHNRADINGDGMIDGFSDNDGNGLDDSVSNSPVREIDSDADGTSDHLDTDSDNDGAFDITEAGGADNNGDGIVDSLADSDGDGIADSVDADFTGGLDVDQDGIDDSADIDFLNDADTDNDGIADQFDPDFNGDGFADSGRLPLLGAAMPDSDNNGIPDFQEASAENQSAAPETQVEYVETGLSGGGCVLNPHQKSVDPTLPLLFLISLLNVFRNVRIAAVKKQCGCDA